MKKLYKYYMRMKKKRVKWRNGKKKERKKDRKTVERREEKG